MKISSDSPDFQSRIDSTGVPTQGDKSFGEALESAAQPLGTTGAANAQPLASIAQSLTKADLADPTKANTAIHQAVNEIMDREFGGMQAPDRQRVASWLGSDPIIRETLLKRLTALAS